MRRYRSFLLAFLVLVAAVSACIGGALYAAKREPEFYAKPPCPTEWDTREKSSHLLTRVQDLKNEIRSKSEWGDTFTADDLNCFFVENMGSGGAFKTMLPEKFHSPRVAIEGDRLKLGFKYRDGFWSTVVWVELKVWLVAEETNVVAVEVCDLRAGCVPVGSQSILDAITEAARGSNVEVTWYRHEGNPVGLFRFFANQPQPASQILTLEVKDGRIVVAGRSFTDQPSAGPLAVVPGKLGE